MFYFLTETINYLQKNPILGIFGGFGSAVIQYIEPANNVFKVSGSALGLVVAVLTIYAKILEIKKHKNK